MISISLLIIICIIFAFMLFIIFNLSLKLKSSHNKLDNTKDILKKKESSVFYKNNENHVLYHDSEFKESLSPYILLVDDEPTSIQVLENYLKMYNYNTISCYSGDEAIKTVEIQGKPSLILLDIMMPNLSGYEVCQKLREKYSAIQLPILLLTAKNQIKDIIYGFEAGANDYLTKPFNKEELLTRVSTLIKLENMNDRLYRLKQFLQKIIDLMPSIIICIDDNKMITHWNIEAEKEINIDAEMATGESIYRIFPFLEQVSKTIDLSLQLKKVQKEVNIEFTPKEGPNKYISIVCYPITYRNSDGIAIRIDDVTEKVQLDSLMIQSEKMLTLGGLAAGLAHEIRNPISSLTNNLQTLKRRLEKDIPGNISAAEASGISIDGLRQYVDERKIMVIISNMEQSTQLISRNIFNMLSFSRKSEGKFTYENISNLLNETLELTLNDSTLRKLYKPSELTITKIFESDLPLIFCERTEIQQVFMNIIKNSLQALYDNLEKKPQLGFTISKDDSHLIIEIGDNGPGMTENTRDKIFNPFFSTKEAGSGTGLGLYITHFIITERHKGEIYVNSKVDVGTSFRLLFLLENQ